MISPTDDSQSTPSQHIVKFKENIQNAKKRTLVEDFQPSGQKMGKWLKSQNKIKEFSKRQREDYKKESKEG